MFSEFRLLLAFGLFFEFVNHSSLNMAASISKRFSVGKDVFLSGMKRGEEICISGKEQRHLKASRCAKYFNRVF